MGLLSTNTGPSYSLGVFPTETPFAAPAAAPAHFTLGVLPPAPPVATPVFNLSLAPAIAQPAIPEYHPSGIGVLTGTAKVFLKDELPPVAKPIALVASAAIKGRELAHNIQRAEDAGQSSSEATTCQTARMVAEETIGKAAKGFVVGGIPPYLAAAAANPALAVTVPVVLPLVPDAYRGAQLFSHKAGDTAEAVCHSGFDLA